MKWFSFNVKALYRTDPIYAKTEDEAREIAIEQLHYDGEEIDTTLTLRWSEGEDDEEDDEEG